MLMSWRLKRLFTVFSPETVCSRATSTELVVWAATPWSCPSSPSWEGSPSSPPPSPSTGEVSHIAQPHRFGLFGDVWIFKTVEKVLQVYQHDADETQTPRDTNGVILLADNQKNILKWLIHNQRLQRTCSVDVLSLKTYKCDQYDL